jgi:hypothetical protein
MTISVKRVVSCLVGQTTFLSSPIISAKKVNLRFLGGAPEACDFLAFAATG